MAKVYHRNWLEHKYLYIWHCDSCKLRNRLMHSIEKRWVRKRPIHCFEQVSIVVPSFLGLTNNLKFISFVTRNDNKEIVSTVKHKLKLKRQVKYRMEPKINIFSLSYQKVPLSLVLFVACVNLSVFEYFESLGCLYLTTFYARIFYFFPVKGYF